MNDILCHFHTNGTSMFILAIVFYIAGYHLLLYSKNKDVSYFYYGMYALLLFVAYSLNVRNNFYYKLIQPFYTDLYVLRYIFAATYAYFYFKFSFVLVNTKLFTPKLHKIINNVLYVFVGYVIVSHLSIFLFDKKEFLEANFMYVMAPLMTAIYVITIYMIIASKSLLKQYLLVGSFLLVGGSLVSMFIYNFHFLSDYSCFAHPIVFSSMLLENIIFSLALGKKQRIIFKERLLYEQELNQEKLNLLRSNLNPHFIFNALNSIKSLIIDNKMKSAIKSLGLFAKMMRNFLNSTQEIEHTLAKELAVLDSYIQTENIRYDEPIEFKIEKQITINEEEICIPSLILQPLVENIIKHGFTFNKKNKKIKLSIHQEKEALVLTITDNGKGLLKENDQLTEKKSGLSITRQRLAFFAKKVNSESSFILTNRYDGKVGAEVTLKLPIITKS